MTKYGDYRPAFVTQRDGSSLANSNCRMASISMGLAYDASPQGSKTSTGKEMRTYTDDQSGGTDSGDAKQAWDRGYDEGLRVMDGNSFDSALADLRAGRLVHLDVWHAKAYACRSGDGTYGHTMAIAPDLNADGWVVGDPWCTDGWHRISESKLRSAAEYWGGQVYGKAAQEPDYPTGGPDPRDPRVLLIVARIVKRLMTQYHPGNPAGDALDDPGDTGGGAILYTTTRAVPATGGSDMGIYWDPTQWNDPGLTLYLDSACTIKVRTTSPGGVLYSLGPVARHDGNGFDGDFYSIIATAELPTDPPADVGCILWAKRSELPESTNAPAQVWDNSLWALAHDITGRYPCPPDGGGATPPDDLATRQAQYDADASALLGPRPA